MAGETAVLEQVNKTNDPTISGYTVPDYGELQPSLKHASVGRKAAIAAFTQIGSHEAVTPLLGIYTDALEAADHSVDVVAVDLEERYGTSLMTTVAGSNVARQLDLLLAAADEIAKTGIATVSLFGRYIALHSQDEILKHIEAIHQDFTLINEPDTSLLDRISTIDKYLFDSRSVEAVKDAVVTTRILEFSKHPELTRLLKSGRISQEEYDKAVLSANEQGETHEDLAPRLQKEGFLPRDTDVVTVDVMPDLENPQRRIWAGAAHSSAEVRKARQVLQPRQEGSDIVIAHIPNEWSLRGEQHEIGNQLLVDYWSHLKPNERPVVIVYADQFKPSLGNTSWLEGITWASNLEDLRNTYYLAKEIALQRSETSLFNPKIVSPLQEVQYDASTDLREWEQITADTYQSLRHVLERIHTRMDMYKTRTINRYSKLFERDSEGNLSSGASMARTSALPDREIKAILDCGTGDGRIAGMLTRLGYNVVGLDISQEQLERAKVRNREEGEGIRGERERAGLSYHELKRLQEEGNIRESIITDDEEAQNHYAFVKGSFFNLETELNQLLCDWKTKYPENDRSAFFTTNDPYAFKDTRNMFADAGFDMAMFNWHTLCEVGDPNNLQDIFRQVKNVLWPGGELVIEIPDRMVEPYASVINEYHRKHPNEPLGTVRESYPDPDDPSKVVEYSPRYFPDRNELVLLLQASGFEIDPEKDIQTYLIDHDDPQTGKKRLEVKELFITARKPKA